MQVQVDIKYNIFEQQIRIVLASLLHNDIITDNSFNYNRIARNAFDKCQYIILQNEIIRGMTENYIKDAKEYFEKLTDERNGRMYRNEHSITIPSTTEEFAFCITEADYHTKISIFNEFLSEMYKANLDFV